MCSFLTLFINHTFTCNPKWPEITEFCEERGLNYADRPDILTRVFKVKLNEMIRDFKEGEVFGVPKQVS